MRTRIKYGLPLVLLVALCATLLTACGKKDVHASSQYYTCIYDNEDGHLIDEIGPGEGKLEVEDDAEEWRVPISQRFWALVPEEQGKDPGAPSQILGTDATYKQTVMWSKAKFYFDQGKICEFVDKHMKRNVPQGIIDDNDITDKFGFNIRNNDQADQVFGEYGIHTVADVPWFKWLNENLTPAMESQGRPLLRRYEWPYYEFEFPVNADSYGILPCVEKDGDLCVQTEEPAQLARKVLEPDFGELLTTEFTDQIDGEFFCGDYDPEKPDQCPSLGVDILKIQLAAEEKDAVQERRDVIDLVEKAETDRQAAELTRNATAAQAARLQAELDQERELQKLEEQFGGVTPEVANAKRAQALAIVEAETAAAQQVAPCRAAGVTGRDCVNLLAVLNGIYPNQNGNTNITVNPESDG